MDELFPWLVTGAAVGVVVYLLMNRDTGMREQTQPLVARCPADQDWISIGSFQGCIPRMYPLGAPVGSDLCPVGQTQVSGYDGSPVCVNVAL